MDLVLSESEVLDEGVTVMSVYDAISYIGR